MSEPSDANRPDVAQANRRLLRRLLLGTMLMFGFGFALIPLYDVFCDITGLNGKTSNQAATLTGAPVDSTRTVTVQFLANVNTPTPWRFKPEMIQMKVHPGQFYQTHYLAENLSGRPLTAQAVPSVSPGLAAQHFKKIECFCFTRQDFAAGEGRDMPLAFMVDPELDPSINTITLSYTFYEVDGRDG